MRVQILAKASVDPSEVVYLEAHGTGTVAGEVSFLVDVLQHSIGMDFLGQRIQGLFGMTLESAPRHMSWLRSQLATWSAAG
jgi:3-oxoacyl-(acyl-carrier-protein) synthase